MTPVHTLSLIDYRSDTKPDYATLGSQLDRFIEIKFPGQRIAIRGISLADHPGLGRRDLISTIQNAGTDRYDPHRQGIHHDYYAPFQVDLHAVPCEVTDQLRGLDDDDYAAADSVMAEFLADMYEGALAERGHPIRVDIFLIYDLDQLVPIIIEEGNNSLAFRFKYTQCKPEALLGLISVGE
ncbi:MAG: hypothetical protein AAF629_32625 [Chloroflexota bacterium]